MGLLRVEIAESKVGAGSVRAAYACGEAGLDPEVQFERHDFFWVFMLR